MYRYGIIGDDMRMRYLYESLVGDGYSARFDGTESADSLIEDCDIIVLPVNAHVILKKCTGKTVLGGFTGEYELPRGALVKNYLENRRYTVKNALATAEGALLVAMQHSPDILAGKRTLVTGFGNIGRLLCIKLLSAGCRVTVCARSALARAEAENLGAESCDFPALFLHPSDIIFNTVPDIVIGRQALLALSPSSFVIELASAPGGVDINAARELGISVISAQGLPGKYCPAFAGRILKDTVIELTEGVSANER